MYEDKLGPIKYKKVIFGLIEFWDPTPGPTKLACQKRFVVSFYRKQNDDSD